MTTKKNKTVTFQLKDPHEAKLHEQAEKEHNFSGLMKRLYTEHLEKRNQQTAGPERQQVAQPQAIKLNGGGIKLDLR
jgi:hypothetical protein